MTRLPTLGYQDEKTVRLKRIFSDMAQGKAVGPFVIAHIESVMILATQANAPREFKGAVISAFLNAIDVLRNSG